MSTTAALLATTRRRFRPSTVAILCFAAIAFAVPMRADTFDDLRQKWLVAITGGTNYDLADAQVQSTIRGITNTAMNRWTNLNTSVGRTYLWSNLTSTTDSAELTTAYNQILDMARGYATWGGALYTNAGLGSAILGALDWMYTNRYNETKSEYDNWWDWEIGVPMALNDAAVMVYPLLSGIQLTNYSKATSKFTPSPAMTGANLMWKTRAVAVRAAMMKDSTKLTACRDAFSQVFPYVTTSDGFYTDGSFIQHGKHPYTGGYGSALLGTVAPLLPWLKGSPWEVTDPAQTNVINWVWNSFHPVVYRGALMDMIRGREISRNGSDHSGGRSIMNSMMQISQFASPDDAAQIRSLIKYYTQTDTTTTWTNFGGLTLLASFRQLLGDTNVVPLPTPIFHKQFPSMDCVVHWRSNWCFAIRMSSTRIYNYESINLENLHAWFTGDGMTYLYNNDLNQFSDSFWPTVNPYRMPGTTVDTTARANSSGQSTAPAKNWVGGASLDEFGAVGMELDAYGSTLTAKKSWFCFDDEIVCLGAGITGGSNPVETVVENRRLGSNGTNEFQFNGASAPATLGWSSNLIGVTSAWLNGSGGYYFPGGANLNALRESRTGALYDINLNYSTNPITRYYLTLWFNHGLNPTNAAYSYAVLPNKTAVEVTNYAARPHYLVLENSTQAQAVRETNLNIVAANFWTPGSKTVDMITSSGQASVITRETAAGLWIGVSDATQTNSSTVTVTLNRAGVSLVSADTGVTVTRLSPTIQLSVNMSGRRGRTAHAVIAYTTNTPPVVSITTPSDADTLDTGNIDITADASDPDLTGYVTNVQFFAGTLALAQFTQAPYAFTWPNVPAGQYTLTARATDNTGRTATSAPVTITVVAHQTLVATGSVWRFTDSGVNLSNAWRALAYNDASWKSGASMLGFGDANGILPVTVVASNRQVTTYFRQKIVVPDPAALRSVQLSIMRDDAAVVYINTNEVWRDTNFPFGAIAYNTLAPVGLTGAAESTWLVQTLDPSVFVPGTNIVAIEVHQNSTTSSDLALDFVLDADFAGGNRPPQVRIISPADGVSVTSSNVVTLVADAGDPDGAVTNVAFFANGSALGQVSTPPFAIAASNLSSGTNTIVAVATDSGGLQATGAPVRVVVVRTAAVTLVPPGSIWKYFDRTNDLGTSWRSNFFNDTAWSSGPSMLGFGDANGLLPATVIASNKQWTTYFRRAFYVSDTTQVQSLAARMLRDDGAVLYLNGVEVWRDTNMPAGVITNSTPALSAVGGAFESLWLSNNINPSFLINGWNQLAAEVHQNALTSSDLAFDFALSGVARITADPQLTVTPGASAVTFTWPATSPFVSLYSATNLAPPVLWTRTTNDASLVNGTWTLALPRSTNTTRFFRLTSEP